LFDRKIRKYQILSIGMAGDFMAAAPQLFHCFGKNFRASRVQANGWSNLELGKNSHEPPDAGLPPYCDQEMPRRSGVPGLRDVVIGE